jgi:hypothetical protein
MPNGPRGNRLQNIPDPAGRDLGSVELEDSFEAPPPGYGGIPPAPAGMSGGGQPFADFMRDLDVCLRALEEDGAAEIPAGAAGPGGRFQPFEAPGSRVMNCAPVHGEVFLDGRHLAREQVEGARSFQELWHDLEASLNRQPKPR